MLASKPKSFTIQSLVAVFACGLALSGCLQTNDKHKTVTVKGMVAKGPLSGATVSLYDVDAAGNVSGAAVATTTTDSKGAWSVTLPAGSSLKLVRAAGGNYVDESDPEPDNAKKRKVQLGASDVLEGVLYAGGNSAALTAVSHALVRQARHESSNLNAFSAEIDSLKQRATVAYGFDPFATQAADPLAPAAGSSAEQINYALVLGGMAYMMNSAAVDLGLPMVNYAVIDAVTKDLADGTIDGREHGVALQLDIGGTAKNLATNLNLAEEMRRFLNNNFQAYTGTSLPTVNTAALVNTAPVANADSAGVNQGGSITIDVLANDSDAEGAALAVSAVDTTGVNGSVMLNGDGTLTYTAGSSFEGTDTFTYTLVDGMNASSTGTVTVKVYSYVGDADGDGYLDVHEVMAGSDPNNAASVPAGTTVSANISAPTSWNLAGSPYRVQAAVTVSGASLSIDAGIVVKFAAGTGLTVGSGSSLDINGGSGQGQQVIFTSLKDDSVQGDSNGDGSATSPAAGDWTGVTFSSGGSSNNFANLDIHYATTGLKVTDTLIDVSKLRTYDSSYGLQLTGAGGGSFTSSLFTRASVSGVLLNTTGAVTLEKNLVLNNGSASSAGGGISIQNAGTGTKLYHNVLRGNSAADGGGLYVGSTINTSATFDIRNNLILQNNAVNTGGGVHMNWKSASATPAVDIQFWHNTVTENVVTATGKGGGFYVSGTSALSMATNILWGNKDGTAAVNEINLVAGAAIAEDYNLTSDKLVLAAANDKKETTAPFVATANWYLKRTSLAVNADNTADTLHTTYPYLWTLTSATTDVAGTQDGSAGDMIDLGYHHDGVGPNVASAATSTFSADLPINVDQINAGLNATITIKFTPKDSVGADLGPVMNVTVTDVGGNGTLGAIKDLGDGAYSVTFTTAAFGGVSDGLMFYVNGTYITFLTINW